ncbi:MAG: diguanylate cyclase [Burkholderiales bacterium]|nr:diguanylate cyclase [Burkholderiales bacterium]MBH2015413.1 diguanylate cyclase [Burkholderiales bacterium]
MTHPGQDESARLRALQRLELLETPTDPELDRLTRAIAASLDSPICLISLVDGHRMWFKSRVGCDVPQAPRHGSPCAHVVDSRLPLTCADLALDARFADHARGRQGQGPGPVRFYAGVPLCFSEQVVGTLCVMDPRPRPDFGADSQALLADFGQIVCDAIRARLIKLQAQRERALFADGPVAALVWSEHPSQPRLQHRSENLAKVMGPEVAIALTAGATLESCVDPRDAADVRLALLSHSRSRLPQNQTRFRLNVDGRWIQLLTFGDHDAEGGLQRIRGYLSDVTRQKQLEATIESTKERLHLAMESARIGSWDMDLVAQKRLCSPRVASMIGLRHEELELTLDEWMALVHPFDRPGLMEKVATRLAMSDEEMAAQRELFSVEYRLRHKQGHHIWVQSCARLVSRDPMGRPARIVGTLIDITDAKAAEQLRSRQQRLLSLVNATQRTFLQDKSLTAACEALFEPLLQLTESRFGFIGLVEPGEGGQLVLRVPSVANISWDTSSHHWHQRHKHAGTGVRFTQMDNLFGHVVTRNAVLCTNDAFNHPANGSSLPGIPELQTFLGVPLRHDGRVVGLIALGNRQEGYEPAMVQMLEPLTLTLGTLIHARAVEEERARAERQLVVQATVDALTGLANRRRFFDVTDSLLSQCRRYGTPATVALMDLDHFKQVNDRHGHAMGDAVLKAFASVLLEVLRESDLPARVGGEEFAVLLPSTTAEEARVPLERIRQLLANRVIEFGGHSARVTVSIGLSEWREELSSPDAWLAQADRALYAAKDGGRNRLCIADSPEKAPSATTR